jgi:DUF1365 family protein
MTPARHTFTYPLAMLYIDLEETDLLFGQSAFWSAHRPAAGWFRQQDYLADKPGNTLQERVQNTLAQAGVNVDGPVRLLTHPRYWGVAMNPISCFYCFDKHNSLKFMIAEVTNTPWQERIAYVLMCDDKLRQQNISFSKQMHVSPFNPMEMHYQTRFNAPANKLYLQLENHDQRGLVTDATLTMKRQAATRTALQSLLWRYPMQTLKVASGIYWQALRLWWKGVPFHPYRPRKQASSTSYSHFPTKEEST